MRVLKGGAAKVRAHQRHLPQGGAREPGALQVRSGEIAFDQTGAKQTHASEVNAAQILWKPHNETRKGGDNVRVLSPPLIPGLDTLFQTIEVFLLLHASQGSIRWP